MVEIVIEADTNQGTVVELAVDGLVFTGIVRNSKILNLKEQNGSNFYDHIIGSVDDLPYTFQAYTNKKFYTISEQV